MTIQPAPNGCRRLSESPPRPRSGRSPGGRTKSVVWEVPRTGSPVAVSHHGTSYTVGSWTKPQHRVLDRAPGPGARIDHSQRHDPFIEMGRRVARLGPTTPTRARRGDQRNYKPASLVRGRGHVSWAVRRGRFSTRSGKSAATPMTVRSARADRGHVALPFCDRAPRGTLPGTKLRSSNDFDRVPRSGTLGGNSAAAVWHMCCFVGVTF